MASARALLLGCNANQLPYLRAARALGFETIGTDRNADAPGASCVDRFHAVAYDDADGLLAVAHAEGLGPGDRIFTASAHLAYEAAAVVAEARGIRFPSQQAVRTALDKSHFYPALERAGLPVPPTQRLRHEDRPELDPDTVYWLKSDFGKSPRYCWRVVDGALPQRPEFDAFYRHTFLLQEEVVGTHLRVNLWADQLAVFARDGEVWSARADLGAAHETISTGLREFVAELGMAGWLTKFDLIEREGVHYVLDLGLDPPLRLRRACEARGIDFAKAYTALYLLGDSSGLPCWSRFHEGSAVRVSSPEGPSPAGDAPCA